jgi:hypothetical protein
MTDGHEPRNGADEDGHEPGSETDGDGREPVDGTDGGPPADGGLGPGVPSDDDGRDEEAPLGDLARRVEQQRDRARESDDDLFERAFDEAGSGTTDEEALWEDLEGESTAEPAEEPAVEDVDEAEDVYVLDKREYCLRCQHFSAPPEVRCTYEGSSILELDDPGHFRVAGCPIVEGTEDLRDR